MNARWLAGKVGASILTLLFVIVFNFFLFRIMGDPTSQLARLPQSSPEEVEKLRSDYGLDKPMMGQFVDYLGDTVTFDYGISQRTRETVWDEMMDALPWTLLLVGVGTLAATADRHLDGGGRRDAARQEGRQTACSASACSPTPRPSTGSGSS